MALQILLGTAGLFVGSFLYAVALRYDPERFVLAPVVRGRSRCSHCRRNLKWYELVPLVSFVLQRGRCRSCHARLGWGYPVSELITGVVFALIAWKLTAPTFGTFHVGYGLLALWLVLGALLALASFIDVRVRIIPDELVVAIAVLGVAITVVGAPAFGLTSGSFLGSYALIFGLRHSLWLNRLAAVAFGFVFFGALLFGTRGRGVGWGDLKLAAALGLAFGWPDIVLIVLLSFIIGTVMLAPLLLFRRLRMKGVVAFGPFIALAAIVVLVWGSTLLHGYFSLFGII